MYQHDGTETFKTQAESGILFRVGFMKSLYANQV